MITIAFDRKEIARGAQGERKGFARRSQGLISAVAGIAIYS
jgi:hypothetical protein